MQNCVIECFLDDPVRKAYMPKTAPKNKQMFSHPIVVCFVMWITSS